MPIFPEVEKTSVKESPEEAPSLTIERKEVASAVPIHFKAQVKTDKGQPLIQTPAGQAVSVILPKSQLELAELAKGSISDSITWFAAFWLRMIKKAIYYGYRIFVKS